MIALLLDLANIVGGFLLAVPLLVDVPRIGDDVTRSDRALRPYDWIVGAAALAAGAYYLILHLTSGPHVFHFEVIGIGVGVALLWERLTGRPRPATGPAVPTITSLPASPASAPRTVIGVAVLLAVFGLVAIIVGVQGLFTPN